MLKPSVKVQSEDGILVAEFFDCLRLDLGAVQELRSKYESHLKGGGRPEMVVDMIGVGFAGSSALGYFVGLQRLARGKNGRLIFCNVDRDVFEVFRVSKLDPLFAFVADRPAALALARNGGEPAPEPAAPAPPDGEAEAAPPPARGGGALRGRRGRKLS